MQRCWSQDPHLRPSFSDICQELDAAEKGGEDAGEGGEGLDAQFPFEIANLVNYAADVIVSPLPPKPYSRGGGKMLSGGPGGEGAGGARGSFVGAFAGSGDAGEPGGAAGSYTTPRNSDMGGLGNTAMSSMPVSPTQQRLYNKGNYS